MNRLRTSLAGWPARAALARESSGSAPHLLPLPPKALAALLCAGVLALAAALALSSPGASAPEATAGSLSSPFSSLSAGLNDLSGLGLQGSAALSEPTAGHRDKAAAAYGRLPLSFEENRGQTDPRVRYMARGAGYSLFLTPQEAVLSLKGKGRDPAAALRLGFEGANPNPAISGHSALPGRVNYLKSSDLAAQQRDIPTFARASYRELWPGIGASFYGRQGQLEYDFELAPHADPSRIVMSFKGAERLRIGARGDLRIGIGEKTVRQLAPQSYQVAGGRRQVVQSRYVLLPGKRVGIRLGAYDRSRPLVIDPVLAYSTYLGGGAQEHPLDIAADAAGSAYVTGSTQSANFPTTFGVLRETDPDPDILARDAFVTKLRPDGTALSYSTYVPDLREADAIAVDAAGSAHLIGRADVGVRGTQGAYQEEPRGGSLDAFVTKLTPDGSALAYSTYLGGARGSESARGIAVDGSGSAYVLGTTALGRFPNLALSDFPTTEGAYDPERNGTRSTSDAFFAKLTPDGSDLAYSTYLGGSGRETSITRTRGGIDVDGSGSAYVFGPTASTDFPTKGAFDPDNNGGEDAFVAKLDPSKSGEQSLAYSTYLGSSVDDEVAGIAVDASGSAYVTGSVDSGDFPTTDNAYDRVLGGCCDAFVAKLDPSKSGVQSLIYSTFVGGSSSTDPGNDGYDTTLFGGIAVDGSGRAHIAGETVSTDFPTTEGAVSRIYNRGDDTNPNDVDGFLTTLNPAGSDLDYSTYLGGSDRDEARAVAFAAGSAYVTGLTGSITDFPITPRAYDREYNGGLDAFISRFAFSPTAVTGPASRISATAARASGTVNPTGSPTTYRFEYGPTTAYGRTTPPRGAGAGTSDRAVSAALSGLAPGRTYHYRLVATNEFGTTAGADRTFRSSVARQCADGRDNDRDARTDFPRDPGCRSRQDNNESDPPPRCTITRGAGNDVIRGTAGRDVICAGAGNDVVYGRGGDDTIRGGEGNDILRGGDGDDRLTGGPGRDTLYGNGGADALDTEDARRGNDVARGGRDPDSCAADPRDMQSSC